MNADLYLTHSYNRFQACRHGFAGTLIDPLRGARPLADDLRETLELIAPHARMLESETALDALHASIGAGNDATWLRRMHAETGTLTDVVRRQADLWASS